jgi:hypothetical protein
LTYVKYWCILVSARQFTQGEIKLKLKALVVALIGATALLSACKGDVTGIVLDVNSPELTQAITKCAEGSWSISVQTNAREEYPPVVSHVCATEAEAKKYKSGDAYP